MRNATVKRSDEARKLAAQARQAEDRGDERTAEVLLTAAVRTNPRDCETRLELSELLLQHGSMKAAAEHLQRLVAQNPDDPRGYVRLAEAYYYLGQYPDAERAVKTALEMDPVHTQGLLLRGKLEELAQRDDQALEIYCRVMTTDQGEVEAPLRIAEIHLRRQHHRQATPLLRSVTENPQACEEQRTAAYWLLGTAYALDDRWKESAAALEVASRSRTMGAGDWYRVAYAQQRANDIAASQRSVGECLKIEPAHAAGNQLALWLEQSGTPPVLAQQPEASAPQSAINQSSAQQSPSGTFMQ